MKTYASESFWLLCIFHLVFSSTIRSIKKLNTNCKTSMIIIMLIKRPESSYLMIPNNAPSAPPILPNWIAQPWVMMMVSFVSVIQTIMYKVDIRPYASSLWNNPLGFYCLYLTLPTIHIARKFVPCQQL